MGFFIIYSLLFVVGEGMCGYVWSLLCSALLSVVSSFLNLRAEEGLASYFT